MTEIEYLRYIAFILTLNLLWDFSKQMKIYVERMIERK